jgi:hypothetical protein
MPLAKLRVKIDTSEILNKREGKNTRKAPADRIIPQNVAHSACETFQNAQETSCVQAPPALGCPAY